MTLMLFIVLLSVVTTVCYLLKVEDPLLKITFPQKDRTCVFDHFL